MQNSFVTDAINLKAYNLSESDKIIVMYSKDKGLIRGVAKGVKKPKSKLGARMDLLVANTLMLHKGKPRYYLPSGSIKHIQQNSPRYR